MHRLVEIIFNNLYISVYWRFSVYRRFILVHLGFTKISYIIIKQS